MLGIGYQTYFGSPSDLSGQILQSLLIGAAAGGIATFLLPELMLIEGLGLIGSMMAQGAIGGVGNVHADLAKKLLGLDYLEDAAKKRGHEVLQRTNEEFAQRNKEFQERQRQTIPPGVVPPMELPMPDFGKQRRQNCWYR